MRYDPKQKPQGAIILFDLISRWTYRETRLWLRRIQLRFGDIPVILCGNKADDPYRKVQKKHITLHKKANNIFAYFDISARTGFNISKPFVALARKISGSSSLGYYEQYDFLRKFLPNIVCGGCLPTPLELEFVSTLCDKPTGDMIPFYGQLKSFGFNMLPEILPRVLVHDHEPTDSELELLSIIYRETIH